jgi:hypothetical protein
MIRKKKPIVRPFAYGESTYDFEGRRQPNSFIDESVYNNYHNYIPDTDTDTKPDNTTKTLLIIAVGGIAFTGLLIWVLGKRKRG